MGKGLHEQLVAASLLNVCDTGAGHRLSHRAWRWWTLAWCYIYIYIYIKIFSFILCYLVCSPFLFGAVQQDISVNFRCFKKYLNIKFLIFILMLTAFFWFCLESSALTGGVWFSVLHPVLLMNLQIAQQSSPPLERRVLGCAASFVWGLGMRIRCFRGLVFYQLLYSHQNNPRWFMGPLCVLSLVHLLPKPKLLVSSWPFFFCH